MLFFSPVSVYTYGITHKIASVGNPGLTRHSRDRGRMWKLIQSGQLFADLEGQHFSSLAAVGKADLLEYVSYVPWSLQILWGINSPIATDRIKSITKIFVVVEKKKELFHMSLGYFLPGLYFCVMASAISTLPLSDLQIVWLGLYLWHSLSVMIFILSESQYKY